MRLFRLVLLLACIALLPACLPRGDPSRPIPYTLHPAAAGEARRLVVVLPGRADDLGALRASGMVEAIQGAWPDADVVLAELTIAFYLDGRAPQRLHDEIVAPMRARGYDAIWLAGASMGGMGATLYDLDYPGDADGLVLLAPYLGGRAVRDEVTAAGGVAAWEPGPPPAGRSRGTVDRDLWRHLRTWARDPARAADVWVAYGDRDRLRDAVPLLAPLLPPDQLLVRPGGHDWEVWSAATAEILRAADAKAGSRPAAPPAGR